MRTLPLVVSVVALLALTGCSTPSGGHREYRQAARPAPAPGPLIVQQPPSYPGTTYTPPGTGLPMPGQPGQKPSVQRSPNTRVLPASNEPGLWAADGAPRAAAHDGSSDNRLFGVDYPLPAKPTEAEVTAAGQCTSELSSTLKTNPRTEGYIDGLPEDVRRCLAAMGVAQCAEELYKGMERGSLRHPKLTSDDLKEALKHAKNVEKGYCSGVVVDLKERLALDWLLQRWRERHVLRLP